MRNADTFAADDIPYWIDLPYEKERSDAHGCLMVPYSYDVSQL